jgi:hypothetical protein
MKITAPQLAMLASRLNAIEEIEDLNRQKDNGVQFRRWKVWMDGGPVGVNETYWSDGELLLEILNRAAQMGYTWRSTFCGYYHRMFFMINGVGQASNGETALEAAALAFIKLPLPGPQPKTS